MSCDAAIGADRTALTARAKSGRNRGPAQQGAAHVSRNRPDRSEEHTSELQSLAYLVCRLLLEKKKSAAQGSENLIADARERLRLWDVTDQEFWRLETEGKMKRAIAVFFFVKGIGIERNLHPFPTRRSSD